MSKRASSETVSLTVRTKEALRVKLEAAALENDVSMNAEIVSRLEKSFDADDRLDEIFGSKSLYGLMKIVASAMAMTGVSFETFMTQVEGIALNGSWMQDQYIYDQAVTAANKILDSFRPSAPSVTAQTIKLYKDSEPFTRNGAKLASGLVDDIIGMRDEADPTAARLARLRSDLGPLVEALRHGRKSK